MLAQLWFYTLTLTISKATPGRETIPSLISLRRHPVRRQTWLAKLWTSTDHASALTAWVWRYRIMASKHARDLKRLQAQIDSLNNELNGAHDEIDRRNTLSGAHKSHISSLQNALEDKKHHLNWYVEKYGYEDPDEYDSYSNSDDGCYW
ncbi:hypothetical protein GGI23_000107 [Coemansia sp. RSA 2559]|nr:hypothetical protein GGI23_000107 [Coemansia sp. RSA 2559]KAJ2869497.1 hypothetical protein GGI22_000214 [Coemansia erecta]